VKQKSGADAGRNGDDSARPPIRQNAEAKYPEASQKSDFGSDQGHRLTFPGARPQAASVGGLFHFLNPEHPNRNDGPEHGQAGNRPTSHVNRAIRFRPVHHGIVPVRHDRLLSLPPFDIRSLSAAQGSMAVASAAAQRFRDRAATKPLFLASEPRFWIYVWRTMPLALRTEWSMGFSATGNAQTMKGSPNRKSGGRICLDRPRAIAILIPRGQHAQQEFFAAAS
jgi:hypothetical protein